jgi:hypothetical protein
MEGQLMRLNLDIGHPEFLLAGGVALAISGHFVTGIIFCSLGFLGAILRSGMRIQKIQQEELARQKLLKEMSNAGEDLASALSTLFGQKKSDSDKAWH